jgi:Na+-transporting methylmalonyl-CoA/oxaloacetate decarboxylase gamma subunit
MDITWGEAFRIGGMGFGTVFLVLSILAGAVVLVGLAIRRTGQGEAEADQGKAEAGQGKANSGKKGD